MINEINLGNMKVSCMWVLKMTMTKISGGRK